MSDQVTPADRPTSAGMYDFYLGGTAHSPADRAAAEKITELMPEIPDGAWANRGFLQRAVTRMAADFGIRQFLDIGAGLPTQRNTHDVVAETISDGRVLYVDIDPHVAARGVEILAGVDNAAVIQGDVRDPDAILSHPKAQRLLDMSEPVGLLLVAVLHFVSDDEDPWSLVSRYLAEFPAGSCLALTHAALAEQVSDQASEAGSQIYRNTSTPFVDRTRSEIERFFAGLEVLPPHPGAAPAVTYIGMWGAEDPGLADSEGSRLGYAAVARKP
jgi:hypothetical protein